MEKITFEEIEQGQTSKENWVRQMWSTRDDYSPTLDQVFRGLKDDHEFTALGYALREDYTPTKEMVQFVVKQGAPCILRAYMSRGDVELNNDNWSEIFDKRAAEFRLKIGNIKEWCPTFEQLERGLSDPAEEVRALFNERKSEWERHLLLQGVNIKERPSLPSAL